MRYLSIVLLLACGCGQKDDSQLIEVHGNDGNVYAVDLNDLPPLPPATGHVSYDLERDGPLPEPKVDEAGRKYNDLPGGGRVYHGAYSEEELRKGLKP